MDPNPVAARVVSVSRDDAHRFSKPTREAIVLIEGIGVEGDAHAGATVQHVHRLARHAAEPNLRQVHLIHSELFAELRDEGFSVFPGQLGENITTGGLDVLGLPAGTRLSLGPDAVIEITGLRNPCTQINRFQSGLMKATLGRDENGHVVRKTGVMSVVLRGGTVRPGDDIVIDLPQQPWSPLETV